MQPYFERTSRDVQFYEEFLRPRLPDAIFDSHVHLNLPEHVAAVTEERVSSDWALECGYVLPCEDAYACVRELYPDSQYSIAGFPWPIREADLEANNAYLADLSGQGLLSPFMCVRPEWPVEKIEGTLLDGQFVGFKPYADMLTGVKGADVSIFDFFPHEQWQILDRHQKAVVLHLPRRDRIADEDNVQELKEARDRYPNVAIIIAHFGRAYCPLYLEEGLDLLGSPEDFHYDTAAVVNPQVYDVAFSRIPTDRILYGSDMPILFWHGRQEWTEREYHNLCREGFSWVTERRSPAEEATYTLFLYEQMRAILDAVDRHGLSDEQKAGIFGENARGILSV